MAFTLQEALSKIGTPGYTDIGDIKELVRQTSVIATDAVPNAVTLLYSGKLSDNVYASSAAEAISNTSLRPLSECRTREKKHRNILYIINFKRRVIQWLL